MTLSRHAQDRLIERVIPLMHPDWHAPICEAQVEQAATEFFETARITRAFPHERTLKREDLGIYAVVNPKLGVVITFGIDSPFLH